MTDINDVLKIHDVLIEKFGGSKGIRDINSLDSAINRPFATFDKKYLYPTPADKAAAIIESIIINHPFIDGNKRTGYVLMRLILIRYGKDIKASQDDKYKFVIGISKGEIRLPQIKEWIKQRLIKRNEP